MCHVYTQESHPSPGRPYRDISETAYLPNTEVGEMVCRMLKVAFRRKLVFTIGRCQTTGEDGVVTWNGIRHDTNIVWYVFTGLRTVCMKNGSETIARSHKFISEISIAMFNSIIGWLLKW